MQVIISGVRQTADRQGKAKRPKGPKPLHSENWATVVIVRGTTLVSPAKLMVRAPNWIGDAVMALPALDALRARFQETEIVVVAKPWVSEIYQRQPCVDRIIVYDALGEHKGAGGFARLVKQLKAESFDSAILFQNAFHAAWMAWRAGIPVRVGYARDGRRRLLTHPIGVPPTAAYGHHANYYLQLLFRASLIARPELPGDESEGEETKEPPEALRLVLDATEVAWARRQLDSQGLQGMRLLVGLAPGASYGPAKRWPADRFADLADRLVESLGADILIFGSAGEKPLAEEIAGGMEHTPTILAGETTLRQLMALMAQCRLVVSNDSGPMHLAAGLGVPLAAIFGSTDERRTGPISTRARVIKEPVPCSPCGLRECPIDFRCMNNVAVDSVYRVALELVKTYRPEKR